MRRIAPLFFIALAAVPAASARAQEAAPQPPTLSVTGNGTARLAPDVAVVEISFVRRLKDATRARNSVNVRAQRLISSARALGIERKEITTGSISLSRTTLRPLHKGGKQRIRYTASTGVTVRVLQLDDTGKLFNAATAAGAQGIDGPSFEFADPSAGRAAAEKAAVEDARKRADAAAALLGQKVVGVQSLELNPNNEEPTAAGQVQSEAAPAPKQSTPAPTPVSAGTESFDATVNAVFLIAPL